jgi:cell division protein FtsL
MQAPESERPRGHEGPDRRRGATEREFVLRRRANGTPLLLATLLAILGAVGIARVHARVEVLELAEEITALTAQQEALLDRKRRLETERAYLRRPSRIHEQARELGMVHVAPEHIQRIRLLEPDQETP